MDWRQVRVWLANERATVRSAARGEKGGDERVRALVVRRLDAHLRRGRDERVRGAWREAAGCAPVQRPRRG
jgi:hypothetical protein